MPYIKFYFIKPKLTSDTRFNCYNRLLSQFAELPIQRMRK